MNSTSTSVDSKKKSNMKIAVAGTGYVGLSIATLLAQHNEVTAVDLIPATAIFISNMLFYASKVDIEFMQMFQKRT